MLSGKRPYLEMLNRDLIEQIINEAYQVLEQIGMLIDNRSVLELLEAHGAKIDFAKQIAKFPPHLIEKALTTAPRSINIYNREGQPAIDMGSQNIHFDPGSAAIWILDDHSNQVRKPITADFIKFSKVVENLQYLDAQATALVCADVPEIVSDSYRLFIAMQYCSKPIVTGAFSIEGFDVIKDMLVAIAGSEEQLRSKPIAIIDCAPSSPLKWSDVISQNLVDCARHGIPAELVSMPLAGAVAPVTLAGSLVQHTAESLSGIAIHQIAQPGSPIIYGGSPAIFDMRKGTTPMGATETTMLDAAYNQIGKHLGLPTHAYMGLSDAKRIDAQAGFETGMGVLMAALSGVNMISGPGMLDFESCQSLPKLAIDNELCGMAKRLVQGIVPRDKVLAVELLRDIHQKEHLLTSPHTLQWMQKEHFMPSEIVDRAPRKQDLTEEITDITQRAQAMVNKLEAMGGKPIDTDRRQALQQIMEAQSKKHNFSLPETLAP